ncbi:microtubule-associated protein 10 [Pogona vitticeps]
MALFLPSAAPGMEGSDGCEESLFSLELLVESARVEPRLLPMPLPACGPFRPAVALRLLDFPTLLVRAPHAAPGPVVPFGRGKSCLFRLRPAALKDLLRRSPLSALLLALPPTPGPARLLGSCSVSLASAAEELLLGTGPGGRRGQFPLQDLMGEQVGELGLSYRLTNLGISLLGHLGEGAAPEQPHPKQERHQEFSRTLGNQSNVRASLELIPEGDEDQEPALEGGSQASLSSPQIERRSNMSGLGEGVRELEIEANVFCPPPMFYTCSSENPHPRSRSPAPAVVTVAPAQNTFPGEEIRVPSPVPLTKEKPSSIIQEVTPSPQILGSPEQLRQTLNQLPLLNALLVELSLLNKQPPQAQPFSVHPQLAWLYKNAEEGTKSPPPIAKSTCPYHEEKKTTHRKERGRSASPKLKRNRPDHLKCISPSFQVNCPSKGFTKLTYSERLGGPEKNNTKENSPPRRKLTYGLTNTLKLRLLRSNPGMLKVHEKRELRRKKQGDVVEKKGKSSSAKGKLLHGSPECHAKSSEHLDEKSIPEEKAQINENVETLIQNSVCHDCPTSKKVAAKAVKNSENGKQNTSIEVVGSAYEEKHLKVHLPRVFLQDAETHENKIDTEVVKYVQHSDSDVSVIHIDTQSNNCESSREVKNLEEVHANSESAAYSEDFTGDDSSGTNLEAQESSHEPLLVNLDQSQSIMDSDSKISERSLADESISSLLPIPSAMSPVHYLKKTCDLKLNGKKPTVSFDKSIDDSPPARMLKEGLGIEQIRKERSKDEQTLETKEVYSDMRCSIAKDQSSAEKSNSLRTSQVSSYLPSNVSDLDLSGLEESNASEKEKEDDFEMVDIANQCKHISELVVNKLPGYTM